jgi:hypothetical protein
MLLQTMTGIEEIVETGSATAPLIGSGFRRRFYGIIGPSKLKTRDPMKLN